MEINDESNQTENEFMHDYFNGEQQAIDPADNTASIIKQIDPALITAKIEYMLKGKIISSKNKIITKGEPLLNEKGINSVMNIIRSYVNLNTTLSINKGEEISSIMKKLLFDLTKMLMLNRGYYGIKNSTTRDEIMQIIVPPINFALKRSLDIGQNDKKFLKGSSQEHIVRNFAEQNNKSYIDRFMGRNN